MLKLPTFTHDCETCTYLGTHREMAMPPMHPFLVGKVDFWRCGDGVNQQHVYVARYGNADNDRMDATAGEIDDWHLVRLLASEGDGGEDGLRLMMKVIRLVDIRGRLDKGYVLVRLAIKPTEPYLLTLPYLLPHEYQIMMAVAPPLLHGIRGRARDKRLMREVDEAIQELVARKANETGYLTIWNKHSFVPPAADEEVERPN